jgi:hypothetical protein
MVKLTLVLVLAVPSVAWLALYASLIVNVRRAETLRSRVKALRLRESTFQDAKNLANQYGSKVRYQSEPCTIEKCTFTIFIPRSWFERPSSTEAAVRAVGRFIGVRAYMVAGSVSVRNGRIMETGFFVDAEAKRGTVGGQWLVAEGKVSDRFSSTTNYYFGHQEGLDEHPNRKVGRPNDVTGKICTKWDMQKRSMLARNC